ncbi:MAG TPA: hypothetical protein VN733_07105, partial [Solirubrobacterales bacterium]|nr:hypothetical protein [Solirubrobacterales bacterium]
PDEMHIEEKSTVRWEEPRPGVVRFPAGHPEVLAVKREQAGRDTVDIALMHCSALIAQHASSDDVEPFVRDVIESFVDSESVLA